MSINLTFAEREELLRELNLERSRREADRIRCILLLDAGKSYEEISLFLYLSSRNIRRFEKIYEVGGLLSLLMFRSSGSVSHINQEQLLELHNHIDCNYITDSKLLVEYVRLSFGVLYSVSGLRKLLTRTGYVYKKTKLVPSQADAAQQELFLDNLQHELSNSSANGSATSVVYFADGVHPTHNSRASRVWCKKGEDKQIKANTGRDRININGAINACNPSELVYHNSDTINAQTTIELFKKLDHKYQFQNQIKEIVVIADNARYYKNKLVQEYLINSKIKLLHLPPYSPNLNLIERLWKILYEKVINNKFFQKFALFKHAVIHFLDNLTQFKTEINQRLTLNFNVVNVTK